MSVQHAAYRKQHRAGESIAELFASLTKTSIATTLSGLLFVNIIVTNSTNSIDTAEQILTPVKRHFSLAERAFNFLTLFRKRNYSV